MDYAPLPNLYTKPKGEIKLIDSKEYILYLNNESYVLLIKTYSDNRICFELKNKNNLTLYYYSEEFIYDEIIELLLLHKAQYEDLSKIMTFFKKAIENKKLELNYNEKNKKMILKVTKVADFEEMQIPIELNEKKISNEEIFRLLFEEIKLIKDNNHKNKEKEEKEHNKNNEIINNLMNKNKENEEYIKKLENKIIALEKVIDNFKNNINEAINKNSKYINDYMSNINKKVDDKIKSINDLKIYVEKSLNDNSNSVNNLIIDIDDKINESKLTLSGIIDEKINENEKSINNFKENINEKFNEKINQSMIIVDKKINENMQKLNNNLDEFMKKYMRSIDETIPHQNLFNISMNNNMNNLNINDMNNINQLNKNNINNMNNNILNLNNPQRNNLSPFIGIRFNKCDDKNNILEQIVIKCFSDDILENVIKKYKNKGGLVGKKLKFFFKGKELNNFKLSLSQIGLNKGEKNNISVFESKK